MYDLDEEKDEINPPLIKIGICAMNKKTSSRPMKEILCRLKRFSLLEFNVFTDETVLNEPIENWPIVDCLVSFYSTGFPLEKAIAYAKLRKPFLLNDLDMQYKLQDRREVYAILEENGIECPRYSIFNRDERNIPVNDMDEIEESDDLIIVNGKTYKKPFVEKPVSAEDHDIYIYYPSTAGGGCQVLFQKIGNRSSVYSSKSTIRREGSYIYEDFMPTDGTDVKVYTVGPEYAHAEARKSPALDGKVDRDGQGKEVRFPVILSGQEKLVAHRVTKAFKQTVCGFDLLRANGQSLVCDVNGFSFVKTSSKYYDDCSQILADVILKYLAPLRWQPRLNLSPPTEHNPNPFVLPELDMELRCVVGIMRHGDRTPKQKMKMVVYHDLFFDFFHKYDGHVEGSLKLKKPKHLHEVLDVAKYLIENYNEEHLQPVHENYGKLIQMKIVLEMYGHFDGINRKVQIKSMHDKRNAGMFAKLRGRNEVQSRTNESPPSLLVIVKWGGELTPMGKNQAENLGRSFRRVYHAGEGRYGRVPGCGLLRLHSTYRHDLKIYASDEGRVQMTAAAFAKGLLALEGELTPILVSLVKSDKYVTNMLDSPGVVNGTMQRVKSRLHNYMHSTHDFTDKDIREIAPHFNSSIARAMKEIKNPLSSCEIVYELIIRLTQQINEMCSKPNGASMLLYQQETLDLMKHRWEKLKKDFKNDNEFDISSIPDIYDCAKYDYLHNSRIGLMGIPELYRCTKALADIVIPQEYGITPDEKLTISKELCGNFYKKIQADLQYNVNQLSDCVHRLDPSESIGVENPHQHVRTRLYFTSESHVHSQINSLKNGMLSKGLSDHQWKRAMYHLNNTAELNYLTQIVFMQYENLTEHPSSKDRFRIEIFFSPGVKTPITTNIAEQLQEESLGNSADFVVKKTEDDAITLKTKAQAQEAHAEKVMRDQRKILDTRASSLDDGYSDRSPSLTRKLSLNVGSPPNGYTLSTLPTLINQPVPFVDEAIDVRGAEVIETLPSLHPLVSLHSSIKQSEMDEFLNDMKSERPKSMSSVDGGGNETQIISGLGYV